MRGARVCVCVCEGVGGMYVQILGFMINGLLQDERNEQGRTKQNSKRGNKHAHIFYKPDVSHIYRFNTP